MKKLVIVFLLFTCSLKAQEKYLLRFEVDPKLAISGAYEYDNTPVLDGTFSLFTQVNNNEYGITTEYANLNPYYFSFGLQYNRNFPILKNIETLIGSEILWLQRGFKSTSKKEWLTYGVNAEARWYISKAIAVNFRYNYKYRPDIKTYKANGSIGVVIVYKNPLSNHFNPQ